MGTYVNSVSVEESNRRWALQMKEGLMRLYHSGKGENIALKYTFEEPFGDPVCVTTPFSLKETILTASRAVVALSSYDAGDKMIFACSGTILKGINAGDRVFVITSASLIRHAQSDLTELKIKVHLGDGQSCVGHLYGQDWHLNVAVISFRNPDTTHPIHGLDLALFSTSSQSDQVFALGRQYNSGRFMFAKGNMLVKSSQKFDCEALMYSSCKLTKCGIGGPLIDGSGNWIGLNFFDDQDTPVLPSFLVTKCWNQLRRFQRVYHPWLGVKLRALVTMSDVEHEKIFQKIPDIHGLMVDKVEEGSPADQSGIQEGVIISEVNGVKLFSVAQLGAVLLDIVEEHKGAAEAGDVGKFIIREVVVKDINFGTSLFPGMTLGELEETRHYRWSVPDVFPYLKESALRFNGTDDVFYVDEGLSEDDGADDVLYVDEDLSEDDGADFVDE